MQVLPIELVHKIYRESTRDFFRDWPAAHWDFYIRAYKGPSFIVYRFATVHELVAEVMTLARSEVPSVYTANHFCELVLKNAHLKYDPTFQTILEISMNGVPKELTIWTELSRLVVSFRGAPEPHRYMPVQGSIAAPLGKLFQTFGPVWNNRDWHLIFNDGTPVTLQRYQTNVDLNMDPETVWILSDKKKARELVFSVMGQ